MITTRALSQRSPILHADRGSSMTSKTLALLLADLGVSEPLPAYTSDDNPALEAQFKGDDTIPDYADRFGSPQDARNWAHPFIHWYNNEHRHTSLGLMTPATVQYGWAAELTVQRQVTLLVAYKKNPERFVKGLPTPPRLPISAVWINPPLEKEAQSS